MPSAKILSEKQAYVADLKAKFESTVSGCVVAYGGINVENDTKLRKELREAGVDYMVVKNTMLRLAVKHFFEFLKIFSVICQDDRKNFKASN